MKPSHTKPESCSLTLAYIATNNWSVIGHLVLLNNVVSILLLGKSHFQLPPWADDNMGDKTKGIASRTKRKILVKIWKRKLLAQFNTPATTSSSSDENNFEDLNVKP